MTTIEQKRKAVEDASYTMTPEQQKKEVPPSSMLKIEQGIFVIMKNGTLLNFPNGNDGPDGDFARWNKTEESKDFWVMVAGRDNFVNMFAEGQEAYALLEKICESCRLECNEDVVLEEINDRIDRLFDPKFSWKVYLGVTKPQPCKLCSAIGSFPTSSGEWTICPDCGGSGVKPSQKVIESYAQ